MKKISLIIAMLFLFFPGIVLGYTVNLYDFTGDDTQVSIDITGDGTKSITFDVLVISPDFADLRGVWFNFDPFPSLSDITVTGEAVTDYLIIENGVVDLGNGANINPEGPYDAGIEIGLAGIGSGDDFYSTSFIVESDNENIILGSDFGARLTSVGDDREGSSKLVVGNVPVPEPATILLIGTGLVGLASWTSRKKFKKINFV